MSRQRRNLSDEQLAELADVVKQEAALRANLDRSDKAQMKKVDKLTLKKNGFYGKKMTCSFVWLYLRK